MRLNPPKRRARITYLLATAAFVALSFASFSALAETVIVKETTVATTPVAVDAQTETTVTTTDTTVSKTQWETTRETLLPTDTRVINLVDFDLNSDRILTRREVGTRLFKIYDTDGNEAIDNNEFEHRAVLTVVPVKTETTVTYDYDGDGVTDRASMTSSTFLERTMLARFDANANGLSPREFTGRAFLAADVNSDKIVNMEEWEASYNAGLDARIQRDAETND